MSDICILKFDHRSDSGPRYVGPFDTQQEALAEADRITAKIMEDLGRWDASYSVVPLHPPAERETRDQCPAAHPVKGIQCELDRGHSGVHAIGALPSARWP